MPSILSYNYMEGDMRHFAHPGILPFSFERLQFRIFEEKASLHTFGIRCCLNNRSERFAEIELRWAPGSELVLLDSLSQFVFRYQGFYENYEPSKVFSTYFGGFDEKGAWFVNKLLDSHEHSPMGVLKANGPEAFMKFLEPPLLRNIQRVWAVECRREHNIWALALDEHHFVQFRRIMKIMFDHKAELIVRANQFWVFEPKYSFYGAVSLPFRLEGQTYYLGRGKIFDGANRPEMVLALPFWLLLREFNSGNSSRPKLGILYRKLQRSKTVKFFEFNFAVS